MGTFCVQIALTYEKDHFDLKSIPSQRYYKTMMFIDTSISILTSRTILYHIFNQNYELKSIFFTYHSHILLLTQFANFANFVILHVGSAQC